MERQLHFLDPDEGRAPGTGADWHLDDETRRRGRDGVAAARRALAAARRRPAA